MKKKRGQRAAPHESSNSRQKLLIIVGPTASGKTPLAVELGRTFDGEVISADSRQVYRGLNVGTGKIKRSEMRGVRHHLLDFASPRRTYTAAHFVKDARRAIIDIAGRGELPIIAGGTGFYIDALVGNVNVPEVPPNQSRRAEMAEWPTEKLFEHLKNLDPKRAATVERENPRRLIRAIEVATALGEIPQHTSRDPLYDTLWIGIVPSREDMRARIEERNATMLAHGLTAEVRRLHEQGVPWKQFEEFGFEYRYAAECVRGKMSRAEVLTAMNQKTWQYAKRQLTYWKRNKDITWFAPDSYEAIENTIRRWL